MPAIVVVGGQWGDEGKGRIVDLLAEKAKIVARYSAGNNAGHTIINELGEFKLHLVPAGIFYPDKICVIGNGVVVDAAELLREIEHLEERGVSVRGRLFLSERAHVIMPWHRLIDELDEKLRGEGAIGTTGRGVGPAFVDKVARAGVRIADLVDREALLSLLSFLVPYKNAVLERLYETSPLDLETVAAEYHDYGARLAPYVADTSGLVHKALEAGDMVLLEGAQGSLLDLDTGTYEYVTSSVPSSLAAGAAIGMGIGPMQIEKVLGVYKAYNTRVGNGPMPTELFDETGRHAPRRRTETRVRVHDGAPAALRLVRRRSGPLQRPHERHLLRGPDSPRRARPDASDQGLHSLPRTRPDHRYDAGCKRGHGVSGTAVRGASGMAEADGRRSSLRRAAPRGPVLCALHTGCPRRANLLGLCGPRTGAGDKARAYNLTKCQKPSPRGSISLQ